MIPTRLADSVAAANLGVSLAVGGVAVEEGFIRALIGELSGYSDVALAVVDGDGPGLNHGFTGEFTFGGNEGPGPVHRGMVGRVGRDGENEDEGGFHLCPFTYAAF